MPPDAAVYPKLQRIKNELDKQNEIIFKAEHERNLLEIERDDLHGISRLTKKRELDSKIERKNEEIDILKSLRKESKVVQTKKQYGDFSLTALSFASISIFSG